VGGDFTLGLYRASAPGLDDPLATTVVPDSAGHSGVASLTSSPDAAGRAPDRNSTCTGILVPYVLFGTRTVCHRWPSLYWTVYWTGSTSIYPSLIRVQRPCTGCTGHNLYLHGYCARTVSSIVREKCLWSSTSLIDSLNCYRHEKQRGRLREGIHQWLCGRSLPMSMSSSAGPASIMQAKVHTRHCSGVGGKEYGLEVHQLS
jgi:hypothetical protein